MKEGMKEGKICQSCGMPMIVEETFGTNADGSKNEDYCCFCFQGGKFTEPKITKEEMTDKVSEFMMQMGMPESQAKRTAKDTIRKLKRWRGK